MNTRKLVVVAACFMLSAFNAKAQNERVKFGAYARAWQENNALGDEDTVSADRLSSGHTLFDLGINMNPDYNTQIQAIIRFRTDLGGFFGSSASAELRQLQVKGNLAKVVGYEVGDIYVKMSPYTFYNSAGDGAINEASMFRNIRTDLAEYDNFNRGNTWWQQGAHVDLGLKFKDMPLEKMMFDAYFLRNRPTGTAGAARFHSGGTVTIEQSKNMTFRANYISLFDLKESDPTDTSVSNPVTTFELDYNRSLGNMDFLFDAEGGFSNLRYANTTATMSENSGIFWDAAAGVKSKKGLKLMLGYRYVEPRFYSSAAQTKRIDFSNNPALFTSVANNPFSPRSISMFDLVRDFGLYNAMITDQLMSYDPRFGNTQPYGVATPNRAGVYADVTYKDSLGKVDAFLNANVMSQVVATNSFIKKNYLLLKTGANLNLHKMLEWEKKFIIKLGGSYESTKRTDDTASVDLSSIILDAGLDLEIWKKVDILGGVKLLAADGNELLPVRDQYNEITGTAPVSFSLKDTETLFGYGFRYRFNKRTYFMVQHHLFKYDNDLTATGDYSFNQFLIFFKMSM